MSNQIVITSGAKVRELNDVIIGTSGVLSSLAFNVANGVPKLDSNAKILVSQLPNSVMEYQGTWNAATNTPTLTNGGAFNQGDVYLCNVAGTTNFGAGPISFIVGDSAIYSGSIWQRSGGATGSVTSVGLSTDGNAITIGSSPITTSGTITANFAGTSGQYINGAGNLTTFPTLLSSVGLSMPSAFSVANSPLTANGTIAVTGAGYPSQYIRGDGTLADFPTSGGGGSSVSYYLNGGTSQGTIGGVTYYEMSKIADTGAGVDFPKTGDGLIVSFLTDANDPAQLNIPAGNWNYEIYASMSSNGGTPQMYAELYVYNGTTFTLISTSSNEILYDGINLNLYTFAMTVPATTLALTDRLAIKLYSTNSGGKTTTVHTQDSHLCQIITTFSTGITALNGLTAQVQYFATGTSGSDFNISSATATHTFNIPSASATNRGLITTGTQTIAGDKTFQATTITIASEYFNLDAIPSSSMGMCLNIKQFSSNLVRGAGYSSIGAIDDTKFTFYLGTASAFNSRQFKLDATNLTLNTPRTYTLPDASGTLALTSDIPSISGTATYVPVFTGTNSLGNSQIWNNGGIIGMGTSYSSPAFSVVASSGDTTMGRLAVNITSFSGGSALQVNGGATISADSYITGIRIGLGAGSLTSNTIVGAGSLGLNTTGYENTAVGNGAMYSNTTGYDNVAIGYASLTLNTTGTYNTAIGSRSLFTNTTGNNNTAIGNLSLNLNTTGSQNSSLGAGSLQANTTGSNNTAIGNVALQQNTTGDNNTAIGSFSSYINTTGANNTSIGASSLSANTTGQYNTAIGSASLNANTTAFYNTAIGYGALNLNTTGAYNTTVGYIAGSAITTGSYNTIVGRYVGTTTMSSNIVLADGQGNIRFRYDGTNTFLSGSVAIGSTTSPSYTLDVSGTGRFTGALYLGGSSGFPTVGLLNRTSDNTLYMVAAASGFTLTDSSLNTMYNASPTNHNWNISNSQKMTLTSIGDLLINDVAANDYAKLQVNATSGTAFALTNTSAAATDIGNVMFFWGTTGYNSMASIGSFWDAASNSNAYLQFKTRGSGVNTERMRITSGGYTKMSSDGTYNNATGSYHEMVQTTTGEVTARFKNKSGNPYGLLFDFSGAAPNNTTNYYIAGGDTGAYRFYIYSNGNIVNANNSYGPISDIKLKENIIDATPKLDKLMQVRIVNYNLINDPKLKQIGVIAQELEQVFPALVDEHLDTDKEGNDLGTTTKSVKMSVFVPILIKAMQEQNQIIQELSNRLIKLESK
jgi:hypothetical protein